MSTLGEAREMRSLSAVCFGLFSKGGGGEEPVGERQHRFSPPGRLSSGVPQIQDRPPSAWCRARRPHHGAGFLGFLGSSAWGCEVRDRGSLGWATSG